MNHMSIEYSAAEFPAAFVHDVAETAASAGQETDQRIETAIAVVFAASAVLVVSYIAVITSLT
jgi:hypothetical protein